MIASTFDVVGDVLIFTAGILTTLSCVEVEVSVILLIGERCRPVIGSLPEIESASVLRIESAPVLKVDVAGTLLGLAVMVASGFTVGLDVVSNLLGLAVGFDVVAASFRLSLGDNVVGALLGLAVGFDVVGASLAVDGLDVVGDLLGLGVCGWIGCGG